MGGDEGLNNVSRVIKSILHGIPDSRKGET